MVMVCKVEKENKKERIRFVRRQNEMEVRGGIADDWRQIMERERWRDGDGQWRVNEKMRRLERLFVAIHEWPWQQFVFGRNDSIAGAKKVEQNSSLPASDARSSFASRQLSRTCHFSIVRGRALASCPCRLQENRLLMHRECRSYIAH